MKRKEMANCMLCIASLKWFMLIEDSISRNLNEFKRHLIPTSHHSPSALEITGIYMS